MKKLFIALILVGVLTSWCFAETNLAVTNSENATAQQTMPTKSRKRNKIRKPSKVNHHNKRTRNNQTK